MKAALGVDVGGTKISAALVSDEGELLGDIYRTATEANRAQDEIEENLVQVLQAALKNAPVSLEHIAGVGLGLPGPLDAKQGVLLTPNNLPTLHGYPVARRVAERLHLPVKINNDANVFALGEAVFGSARQSDIVIGLTLGTGFGCGVVLNRKIFEGATGTAGEIYLSPYNNTQFEEIISGRGLARLYEKHSGQKVIGPEIESRARLGEEAALNSWREFGFHLGRIIAHMVNFLDPDAVVVGGSISHAFDLFEPEMRKQIEGNINPNPREHVKILKSRLGEEAAIFGAAALILERSQ